MTRAGRGEWVDHIVASRLQTLRDVALACMGTVAVIVGDDKPMPVVEALVDSALESGFVVATASLAEHGLDDLHAIVNALAASMRAPRVDAGRRNGLVAALDAFAQVHGRRAEALFEQSAGEEAVGGELSMLAREYIASASGTGPARKLQAWLGGREVTRETEPLRPLSARTSKRALADLTRLVRALGHRGMRVVLRDAEALVDLSPGRRDVAYTVLRELVDNTDGGHGVVACETLLLGTRDLERRVHAPFEHPALAMRIVADLAPGPPIPHQTWVALSPDDPSAPLPPVPKPYETRERHAHQLGALVRIMQGLPPLEAVPDLTVGMQEVDVRIAQLFETASNHGSVFAILLGEYGSGKTHHLLHLEARARADCRPVMRLSVERLDEDIGNPQRHMRRLIENATFSRKRPLGFLDHLDAWLSKPASRKRLRHALDAVVAVEGEAARPAARAIAKAPEDDIDDSAVRETLSALDLVDKSSNASYRKDAYARLHLWLDLLERLEACEGPVLILDEAENLYRVGVSRSERRTALRSLAHYCGGALPRATVVLALTPDTLIALREEAGELLDQIEEQATLLPSEDVAMLRHRLLKARPIRVTKLGPSDLETLADQARTLAREVRGKHVDRQIRAFLEQALKDSDTPRELLRRVLLREERLAWFDDDGDRE
jgi:bacteriophage exclusion system BrxC/D-like protein